VESNDVTAVYNDNIQNKKKTKKTNARKLIQLPTTPSTTTAEKQHKTSASYPDCTSMIKQRIENILKTLVLKKVYKFVYQSFCRMYLKKYGVKLNVDPTVVRSYINTIHPWQVVKIKYGHSTYYYLQNKDMIATHDEGDEVRTDRLNHGEKEWTSKEKRSNKSKMSYYGNKLSSSSSNDKMAMLDDETLDSLSLDRSTATHSVLNYIKSYNPVSSLSSKKISKYELRELLSTTASFIHPKTSTHSSSTKHKDEFSSSKRTTRNSSLTASRWPSSSAAADTESTPTISMTTSTGDE